MTDNWTDSSEPEAYDDSEGLYDDGEAYDDESRASRRRERARRLAVLRRRDQARRVAQLSSAGNRPVAQQAARAVADLDVETKVQRDEFRSALAAVNRRAVWAGWSAAGTALLEGGFRAFGTPDNKFVEAGIRAVPLLPLLAGTPRGSGAAGILTSPPAIGIGGLLALAFIADRRANDSAVRQIEILGPTTLVSGKRDVFVADVLDGRGHVLGTAVSWKSDKPEVAAINPTTGEIVAVALGVTVIHAIAGDVDRKFRLEVVVDPAAVAGDGAPAAGDGTAIAVKAK
ncbi:MAG TPA: Ig-like domain-containing protein [Kribbellaceae bacterium]|jgi:hypothetical protein